VFLADGKVSLSVPPGALTEEIWFTALPVTSVPGDDLLLSGTTYEIGPAGTHFNRPVALTVSYQAGAVPKGVGEGGLALYTVSGNAWELTDQSAVNPAARSVSGQVMGLGKFGVLGMELASLEVSPEAVLIEPGDSIQVKAVPRASDGRSLTSRPVVWSTSDSSTAKVDQVGMVSGVAEGTATVTALSGGMSSTVEVVVRIPVASVVVSPGSATLNLGETTQFQAAAYDADGSVLQGREIVWESNNPAVATVDGSGRVTSASVGSVTITATAEGRAGAATVSVHAVLGVSTAFLAEGIVGEPYAQALAASGGNGTYSWSIAEGSLPAGLTLEPATGVVSGLPAVEGTDTFSVEVASGGQTAQRILALTVRPAPVASVTVSPTSVGLRPNQTFALSATARDAAGTVLEGRHFEWWSSDPAVVVVSSDGILTGVSVGSAIVTATLDGRSDLATVTVRDSLVVVDTLLAMGVVGERYGDTLNATGGSGGYTWSVIDGSLPAGLILSDSTGVIQGEPSREGVSIFTVEVASGDGQTASRILSISVRAVLTVQTNSLADATVGMPYNQALSATGGDGSYTWSLSDGTLPGGLSLDEETGVISGTATAAGWSSFTVQVESAGQTKTKALTITVW
jgi:uncharacterized protein YjdB